MLNRLRKEQEGLTLIELIVVVAIIGVLAWLITPRVLEALNTSKRQSALAVAAEIQSGLERWATENDASYPTDDSIGDPITTWDDLMWALGDHITVATNDTANLELGDPAGSITIGYVVDNTVVTGPEVCFVVRARDREGTWIQVQATGIDTIIAASAPACP